MRWADRERTQTCTRMPNSDETDDGELTSEQRARVALLTEDEVKQLDAALLSNTSESWRKVAFVVGKTMLKHQRGRELRVPDVYYSERVRVLVERGLLESVGNLRRMRFSEVGRRISVLDTNS